MSRLRRTRSLLIATVTVLVVAGGAYAYWTVTGAGSGSAATQAATSAVTINQSTTVAAMYPGDSAQTLTGTFNNPNAGPVYVTSVTVSIGSVTKATGAPTGTCDASDYTLANATMAVGNEVPSGSAKGSWTGASIKFNNKFSNQDACKGATVNLAYSSN